MAVMKEQDIVQLVLEDEWMMNILHTVQSLQLPDWWVCAGFVRAKIWDVLHGFTERTLLPDVDVVYFDRHHLNETVEKRLEEQLRQLNPAIPWSVKNEARMHVKNNVPPYTSAVDAISKFPETATALGLSLNAQNQLLLAAPCGIADVVNLIVRPTPYFTESPERAALYEKRILQKNWQRTWTQLTIEHIDPSITNHP